MADLDDVLYSAAFDVAVHALALALSSDLALSIHIGASFPSVQFEEPQRLPIVVTAARICRFHPVLRARHCVAVLRDIHHTANAEHTAVTADTASPGHTDESGSV